MHAVLAAADALGAPAVFLLGDPAYYQRFGFDLALRAGVQPPQAEWREHFQVPRLTTWTDSISGNVPVRPSLELAVRTTTSAPAIPNPRKSRK
jgi:putative acetyltransferase